MNSYTRLTRIIFLADLVLLYLAFLFSHFLIFKISNFNQASAAFFILCIICWILISFFNKNHTVIKRLNLNEILDKLLMTLTYQSIIVLAIIYFFKIENISRGFVLIGFCVFFFLIISDRLVIYFILQKRSFDWARRKNIIVLGNSKIANSLIENIKNNPGYCYHLNEYISDHQILEKGVDGLFHILLDKKPDEIYVCYKEMDLELLDKLIHFGEKNEMNINVVFDIIQDTEQNIFKYENYPILRINSNPRTSRKVKFLKRGFDILFASSLMIIGTPIFFILYIITKISSEGPAFYRQERIGKDEKPFYIYKFRSMFIDAEAAGPQLSKENDPRVTKWGRFMRKTRLDELPQFWNVLKGEMSIVGYRPERKHYIEEITKKVPDYKSLFYHKPGITSLGQIHYGYAENVEQMCERSKFDLLYIRNLNLVLDVNIILQTVKVMVQGKGR